VFTAHRFFEANVYSIFLIVILTLTCSLNAAQASKTAKIPLNNKVNQVEEQKSDEPPTVLFNPANMGPVIDSGLFAKKPVHEKLETALSNFLTCCHPRKDDSTYRLSPRKFAQSHKIKLKDDMVLIELTFHEGHIADEITPDQLKRFGVEVDSRSKHFITLWAPIDRLADFAESLDIVILVHRPRESIPHVTTQGFELVGADVFHDRGVRGDGVQVAIIDGSFENAVTARNRNELGQFTVRNFTNEDFDEGGIHGTGCAEIVYDFVPEADMFLVKTLYSSHFERALDYSRQQGIDVISRSMGNPLPVGDYFRGRDQLSLLLNDAFDDGIFICNSAGNSAEAHYRDVFDDDGRNDHYHVFARNVVVNNFGSSPNRNYTLDPGEVLLIVLAWDDFPRTDQDFDLELMRRDGNQWQVADRSNDRQNGNDNPTESIIFEIEERGEYGIRILRFDADNGMDFTLIAYPHDLGYNTPEGSVAIPALAEGCFAVGAIDYRRWEDDEPRIESFSSRGPTYDGRIKPDICGPDGVSTWVYRVSFSGTSASCPHAAGAASLVLSQNRNMDNVELREYLEENAIDIGVNGQDNTFGYGKLNIDPDAQENPDDDWIYYDDGNPEDNYTVENYWSKVTFTVEIEQFELRGIRFMPYNPGPNSDAPCHIRVYSEHDNHNLNRLLWQATIEELQPWDDENVENNWHWIPVPEQDRVEFEQGENFTIMYGPAPGGEFDPEDINEGDGWWNLVDEEMDSERSYYFIGNNPANLHADWTLMEADLLLRATLNPEEPEPPRIRVNPPGIESNQGGRYSVGISNHGDCLLRWSSEIEYLSGNGWIDLEPEEGEIGPGENERMVIILDPEELNDGDYEAELHILSNDPDNNDVEVNILMHLSDAEVPDIAVEPLAIDFGEVNIGQVGEEPLLIHNRGNVDLVILEFTVTGRYFSVDHNMAIIEPDDAEEVTVSFAPMNSGELNESLIIFSNDPDNEEVIIPLHGVGIVGVYPDISVDPLAIDFGEVEVEQSEERRITINNRGDADLIVLEVSITGEYFSTDFEMAVIEPGESETVTVAFTPEEALEFYGALTIFSNDPDQEELTVSLQGIGWSSAAGEFFSPIPDKFYLSAAHPNPFNATTTFSYGLPHNTKVTIRVYDTADRLVTTLVDDIYTAGRYTAFWNALSAPTGVYFVKMTASGFKTCRNVALVK